MNKKTIERKSCVSGWNHAIIQAQTDWNRGQYTKISNGGNPDCFVVAIRW